MRLLESTVFQMGVIILGICALVIMTDDSVKPALTWTDWMEYAQTFLYTYAGKEGIKYGSAAYKDKAA